MNPAYPPIHFNDRLVRRLGIPVVGFFVPLVFLDHTLDNGFLAYLPVWIIAMGHTFIYWEGNRQIFIQTRRRFPLVAQTNQRMAWLVALAVLYTLIACTIVNWGMDLYLPDQNQIQYTALQMYSASFIPTVTCLALYESVYYFRQLQAALLEAEQLKKENLQSQLETLKNQVNPHFLFNSLNTLSAIIPDDAELAVEFVQKLSNVYRYILEIREMQTVSLRDELSALRAYIFLMQIRFGTNVNFHLDIPDERLSDRVVPLSLQMLVENAVKHNIISTHRPLFIEVFIQKDRVIVRNNLQRKNQDTDSTNLGLSNIRNRYRLLANQPVDVIVTTQSFVVSLPLLTESADVHERVAH